MQAAPVVYKRLRRFKHQAALDCGALASSGYRAALVFGIRAVVTGIRMALGFRTANSVCLRRGGYAGTFGAWQAPATVGPGESHSNIEIQLPENDVCYTAKCFICKEKDTI
jgi:hypothetical protein